MHLRNSFLKASVLMRRLVYSLAIFSSKRVSIWMYICTSSRDICRNLILVNIWNSMDCES